MGKKPLPLRIDEDLLRRVDERCKVLGQTRTLFVERALEAALNGGHVIAIDQSLVEAAKKLPAAPLGFTPEEDALHAEAERRAMARVAPWGECPHGRCSLCGPLGEPCPNHPNLRFKA